MKSEIIDLIHQISTEEAGIYSSLFGFEGFDIKKHINTNMVLPKDDDLYKIVKIYLDFIIAEILKNTDLEIDDTFSSNFIECNNVEYKNPFIQKSYDITNVYNICDFDNILDSLQVTDNGDYLVLNLNIPIYEFQ